MNILNNRRSKLSKSKIEAQINKMMNSSFGIYHFTLGFDYEIVEGKVC